MDRSSQGQRLLAFQRANGISHHTASAHRATYSPSDPPRHAPHGARRAVRKQIESDHKWALPVAIAFGLLVWVASILYGPPQQLAAAPQDGSAGVSR